MPQLLSQFTLKDLVTYLLLGCALWYNTLGGQKDKDAEQDKQLALQAQNQQLLSKTMEENTKALQQVQITLAQTTTKLEQLSKQK